MKYEVQCSDVSDKDNVFVLPGVTYRDVTAGMIRSKFPLEGKFHMRFEYPIGGQLVWMDLRDNDRVPPVRGAVHTKWRVSA